MPRKPAEDPLHTLSTHDASRRKPAMKSILNHELLSKEGISATAARALISTAAALRRAAQEGVEQHLLRGKNIAVLRAGGNCKGAHDFDAAASRLGARVSHVAPDQALLAADSNSTRVLAKLYDAIECEDLSCEDALRLQHEVGVPVYNGLARTDHPLARLLPELPAPPSAEDPIYLVQAALVQTIG